MTFGELVFWFFAVILVGSAIGVITARNPVHAVLLLVLAFCTSAAIWIQLQAEFLAIALVLVYVGAVMVLFLFVVMMLDINLARMRQGFWSYLPLGAFVALLLVAEMWIVLGGRLAGFHDVPSPPPLAADHPLRHRPDQMHLLRFLRGKLPGGLDRRDPGSRVPRRAAR